MAEQTQQQFNQAFAPSRRFFEVAVDHAERLSHFQIEAARGYVDLGLRQTRSFLAITDTRSLQDYTSRQNEFASEISRKVTDDVETLAGFGKSFSDATAELVRGNAENTQAAAQKTAKSA